MSLHIREKRFNTATKAMYANDASNCRQVPIGVVVLTATS